MAALLVARRGNPVDLVAPNAETAVAEALTARGLVCEADDVAWIVGPHGVWGTVAGGATALVRAHASAGSSEARDRTPGGDSGEPADLYLVDARLSPEGVVLEVGDAYDLTETSAVDESRPVVRGHVAAYTTTADGLYTGVHLLDLAGRATGTYHDFTRTQRAQLALTNLQQTGQTAGVVHDTFALDPVARQVTLAWRDDGMLAVVADDHAVVIDPGVGCSSPNSGERADSCPRAVSGDAYVRIVPDEKARPGNVVTWAVDRVRAMPWFGDDRMQWVKAVAFTALDRWHARFSHGTTAQDVQDELGLPTAPAEAPTFTDPEVGWPPAPMTVPVSPALPGEGQWIALDHDPFITPTAAGTAPAFVTSWVRPDVHRTDVRVYVTLWDPRQIALQMEAGTTEPISANGEHGPGTIPRTPEVMKHVVAAFNGGFQAQHGEYGMQANGIEYLPPKPYAATVAELRDGSTAFGTWPDSAVVPDDVIAFRQNLTALVEFGKFNPWGRNWWGGTPPGWPDQIHSARSAICLTKDGFAGYFYSASISAEDLALGMLDARCSYGIHLDMNPGHAGFEFYDIATEGHLAPLGRPMQNDWEAEGKVSGLEGWVFRSRRMIKGMGHMLFPRYIQREARDFFYLTSRATLPGAPVAVGPGAEADEGKWRTRGLPQHGFPYALATTWVHCDSRPGLKLRVVRADPRTMKPGPATELPGAADSDPAVLGLAASSHGDVSLWWASGVFSVAVNSPMKDATRLAAGYALTAGPAATARAAAGVQDEDGMLVWVELPPEAKPDAQTAAAMDSILDKLGCSTRIALAGDAHALLGGTLDAAGNAAPGLPTSTVRLVRAHAPDAHPFFEATQVVPVEVWRPLQAKRVRYFYKPAPTASGSASAAPPATPGH
jgi:hypothetical protein